MADEFVGIAQFVEPAAVAVDDDVFEISAATETHCVQRGNFLFVGDSSGGRNFRAVNFLANFKIRVLNANQRVRIDGSETDAETVVGQRHDKFFAVVRISAINFFKAKFAASGGLSNFFSGTNQIAKAERIAIHDGRLLGVHFDDAVIHAAGT